jgi:hypothetical protein
MALELMPLAPGGEFGFDGECDEDAHGFKSRKALVGRPATTKS